MRVTHLLQSYEIFILFQSDTPLLAVGHFVYLVIFIHQRNHQNMANSSEFDTENMTVCLMQCGEEKRRISTLCC